MIRAPVDPNGWPRAIAPPCTLTRSRSSPRSSTEASTWTANASLISARSMSEIDKPARDRASCVAATGPRPMISGLRPVAAVLTIRASGVRPSSAALVSLMITTAAAPSLRGQQLPAVTVPSSRKTGLSWETPSRVVPGRGPSSVLTTVPSGSVTGAISRAKKPWAMACSARFWERTPKASWSARGIPRRVATFSAVWPIEM